MVIVFELTTYQMFAGGVPTPSGIYVLRISKAVSLENVAIWNNQSTPTLQPSHASSAPCRTWRSPEKNRIVYTRRLAYTQTLIQER